MTITPVRPKGLLSSMLSSDLYPSGSVLVASIISGVHGQKASSTDAMVR